MRPSNTVSSRKFVFKTIGIISLPNFLTLNHVLILRDGVGDDDCLEVARLQPGQRVPGEDAVGEDGVDLLGSVLTQLLGSLQGIAHKKTRR